MAQSRTTTPISSDPAGVADTSNSSHWIEANQLALVAEMNRIRDLLHGEGSDKPAANPPALAHLCAALRLTSFERDLLLLCAGIELDAQFSSLCAERNGDGNRGYATFGLAFAALPNGHWSALTPDAPLRHWRLVDLGAGPALASCPLRIDERILHFLTGLDGLDTRFAGLVTPVAPAGQLAPSQAELASAIVETWSPNPASVEIPVIQLCGHNGEDAYAIAATAAGELAFPLYAISALDLPGEPQAFDEFVRLWTREAALSGCLLLVDCSALEAADIQRRHYTQKLIQQLVCPLLIWAHEPLGDIRRRSVNLEVPRPSHAEQVALWQTALGSAAVALNGTVESLATQFSLSAHTIGQVAAQQVTDGEVNAAQLWDACRSRVRGRLDELAQRINPLATWDDLVLPEGQRQQLVAIAAHVRRQMQVYETWGFARKHNRGLGVSALFAGASGTGKTMAAEVLANELRLDLYRIDLSQVVSKYIGETEKNLRRVFDAAEDSGSILLFDEADALFGKRSEVRDSHDRYANIEVSYLLQRMEAYRGLAILTTNLKHALDPAFQRRLRFIVNFPFPDAAQRAAIWRGIFPSQTPTAALSVERLAQLNVAGGHIRNMALHAAFLAADAGQPVQMGHVLSAARTEYAKLEKPLSEVERLGEP